jgi:LacI family transcriptional regulator
LDAVAASGDGGFSADVVLYGEWSERWGRQAAGQLLRTSPDVDAIFCGSDQIARGVSDALQLMGCKVPGDRHAGRQA